MRSINSLFKKLPKGSPRSMGEMLKDQRKSTGRTQKEQAVVIGISRETVIAIENDKMGTIDSIELMIVSKWFNSCNSDMSEFSKNVYRSVIKKLLHL